MCSDDLPSSRHEKFTWAKEPTGARHRRRATGEEVECDNDAGVGSSSTLEQEATGRLRSVDPHTLDSITFSQCVECLSPDLDDNMSTES